jgi:serine protease Do
MKGSWRTVLLSAVALALLTAATRADPPTSDRTKGDGKLPLPAVLDKKAPENARDLAELQEHVKKVLARVIPATVGIRIGGAAGSGVIIDAAGNVLTAGHVSGEPGRTRNCIVILPDGRELKAKTLGQNRGIDSGLIQILAKGKYPYVDMGESSKVKPSQWVLSIGHPGGFKKGRSPVVRLGRVVAANQNVIRTDCTLVGGDSGGPLFDMQGKVIGIHSRIGLPITENVHVPVDTYRETWDRLVKGESWGAPFGRRRGAPPYMGVRFTRGGGDLKIEHIYEKTPAEQAGLKAGDLVLAIDGTRLKDRDDLFEFMRRKRVGDEITILVQRGDEEVKVKLKLATRPEE